VAQHADTAGIMLKPGIVEAAGSTSLLEPFSHVFIHRLDRKPP
jgi:hypothetical protein